MQVLGGHTLIALDGTEFYCSDNIHCSNCSHRQRGRKGVEYFHTMLAASIVAPGHNRAVPLEPEFVAPRDGHETQDCESRPTRRWLAARGARYAGLKPLYLGDDLSSRQPICEAVRQQGGHFLFVCKPGSHPAIEEFRAGIVLDQRVERVRRGKQAATHRYRWLCGVPLRGCANAITVNRVDIEIADAKGAITYRNSFVTNLPEHRDNVRRTGGLWPHAVEDRERDVQRSQDQELQSGTQFRTWETPPCPRSGYIFVRWAKVWAAANFSCADLAWWILCVMCLRHPSSPV